MKRSGLPPRRTPLARGRPPRKRSPKRKASEFARCYHSKARVAFVASLPCACGCGGGPCENAHTESGGMGRKGDYDTIIPLTTACHYRVHQHGWNAIGMGSEITRVYEALATERLWQAHRESKGEE